MRFLTAWFCPFAHRVHVALEHSKLKYEWVEALGWVEKDGLWHHWKSPELQASSALGTVPVLVPEPPAPDAAAGAAVGGIVHESIVCVEYVDEVAQAGPQPPAPMLPADPWARARCRNATDFVNKRLCSPYYEVLVKRDDAERRAAFNGLVASLAQFSVQLGETPGPLYGGEHPSMVDVVLLPHAYRYYVLEHFRGPDFAVPATPELLPFHAWLEAMVALPAVQRTLPDKGRYLEHVRKYANATARSHVANAVRSGKAAHEMS